LESRVDIWELGRYLGIGMENRDRRDKRGEIGKFFIDFL